MYILALVATLSIVSLAQDDTDTPAAEGTPANAKEFEGFDLKVSKGLQGETARGTATPGSTTRAGDKVVTEAGHEIAFIELDPKEESSLPPAWVVAGAVGGGMLLLGVLATLLMLRASSASNEPADGG